jgi:hypothetical protein
MFRLKLELCPGCRNFDPGSQTVLGHILLGHILLGHILLGHILLGHILLGHILLVWEYHVLSI